MNYEIEFVSEVVFGGVENGTLVLIEVNLIDQQQEIIPLDIQFFSDFSVSLDRPEGSSPARDA